MPPTDPSEPISSATESALAPTRRKMLGSLAAAGALLGLNATTASAAGSDPTPEAPPPSHTSDALVSMARLRDYKCRRSSSWDRTGGNADFAPVNPGASITLLDTKGPGVITHIWFTINSNDQMHLKNLVLRAWWDGESSPSIEAPIGDFYGLMLGEYFVYQSALLAVAPMKALNAYFQMPFESAARITLTNEGKVRTNNLYYAIDYTTVPALPPDLGRFHAQYRQAAPCKKSTDTTGKNLDGKDNYVFLEATGRGHFVGVTQGVLQNADGWFGEGDDMFFIDGDTQPTINGAPAPRTITTARGTSMATSSPTFARARPISSIPNAPAAAIASTAGTRRATSPSTNPSRSLSNTATPTTALTISIRWPTGIRPSPTPNSRHSRPPKHACQRSS